MSRVTVVVATHNRRRQLERYLHRHRAPVVVVDNGSDDGTPELVRERFPQARLIRLAANIGAAARNVGVEAAGTPYVAFADDDSYWPGDSLDRAAGLFDAHPRAALLTGRVLVGERRRLDPVSALMAAAPLGVQPDLPGPSVLGFLACAAVVRREPFLAVGGFEPKLLVYGEEALLAMDLAGAGWGLAYVPSLVVRHLPEPDGRDQRGRRRRQARNDLLTTWLRRPAAVGVRAALRTSVRRSGFGGLVDALAELAWVRRHRRVIRPEVEAALRTLE
jgi:N-acetylglucosaminyl-diphospho-decaprenol L-rhamnosyltransferase